MTMKQSLFERCQGPGAISISAMVEKADRRIAALKDEYGDDFHALADNIEIVAQSAFADRGSTAQQALLLAAIQDIASSAATAGYVSVSAIASHLHDCLTQNGLLDFGSPQIVALHIDAMRGAAKSRSADWTRVLGELRQAASVIGERLKPVIRRD